MNKLQIRVNREDAEIIAKALKSYAEDEPRVDLAPRAHRLMLWIEYRIDQYWGSLTPGAGDDPGCVPSTRSARSADSEAASAP